MTPNPDEFKRTCWGCRGGAKQRARKRMTNKASWSIYQGYLGCSIMFHWHVGPTAHSRLFGPMQADGDCRYSSKSNVRGGNAVLINNRWYNPARVTVKKQLLSIFTCRSCIIICDIISSDVARLQEFWEFICHMHRYACMTHSETFPWVTLGL